jgi:hypothetical protein
MLASMFYTLSRARQKRGHPGAMPARRPGFLEYHHNSEIYVQLNPPISVPIWSGQPIAIKAVPGLSLTAIKAGPPGCGLASPLGNLQRRPQRQSRPPPSQTPPPHTPGVPQPPPFQLLPPQPQAPGLQHMPLGPQVWPPPQQVEPQQVEPDEQKVPPHGTEPDGAHWLLIQLPDEQQEPPHWLDPAGQQMLPLHTPVQQLLPHSVWPLWQHWPAPAQNAPAAKSAMAVVAMISNQRVGGIDACIKAFTAYIRQRNTCTHIQ